MRVFWRNLIFVYLSLAVVMSIASGCRKKVKEVEPYTISPNKFTNWGVTKLPSTRLTTDAMKFVVDLKQRDELPGADTNLWLMAIVGSKDPTNYPISRSFIQKLDNGLLNHYLVTKDLPESQWQLRRAWRTGKTTNVVEEFPIVPRS